MLRIWDERAMLRVVGGRICLAVVEEPTLLQVFEKLSPFCIFSTRSGLTAVCPLGWITHNQTGCCALSPTSLRPQSALR